MGNSYYKIDEANEVELQLNSVPAWLIKIVLPILLLIVVGLPTLLYFISYPDTELVKIKIIPSNFPIALIDKELEIDTLFFQQGTFVSQGTIVGIATNGKNIISPIEGILHLNYEFESKKIIPVVNPGVNSYVVRGVIPVESIRHIQKGQKVNIDLLSYPAKEFGYISGSINEISSVPLEQRYTLDIILTNELYTSKDIKIDPVNILEGEAKIFVSEKRILVKILEAVKGK